MFNAALPPTHDPPQLVLWNDMYRNSTTKEEKMCEKLLPFSPQLEQWHYLESQPNKILLSIPIKQLAMYPRDITASESL